MKVKFSPNLTVSSHTLNLAHMGMFIYADFAIWMFIFIKQKNDQKSGFSLFASSFSLF